MSGLTVKSFKDRIATDASDNKTDNKINFAGGATFTGIDLDSDDTEITLTKDQFNKLQDGSIHIEDGGDVTGSKGNFSITRDGKVIKINIAGGTDITAEQLQKKINTGDSSNSDLLSKSSTEIDITSADEFDRFASLINDKDTSDANFNNLIKDIDLKSAKGQELVEEIAANLSTKLTDAKITDEEKKRYLSLLDGMGILGAVGHQMMMEDDSDDNDVTAKLNKLLGSTGTVTNTHFASELIAYSATQSDSELTGDDKAVTNIKAFVKGESDDKDFGNRFNTQELPKMKKLLGTISGSADGDSGNYGLLKGNDDDTNTADADTQKTNLVYLLSEVSEGTVKALETTLKGTSDDKLVANILKESPDNYKTPDQVMDLIKELIKNSDGKVIGTNNDTMAMLDKVLSQWSGDNSEISTDDKDKLVKKIADYFVRNSSKFIARENDSYQEKLLKTRQRANLVVMTEKLGLTQSISEKMLADGHEKAVSAFTDLAPPQPTVSSTSGAGSNGGNPYSGYGGNPAGGMDPMMVQQLMYTMMGGNMYGGLSGMGSPMMGANPSLAAYSGGSPYGAGLGIPSLGISLADPFNITGTGTGILRM